MTLSGLVGLAAIFLYLFDPGTAGQSIYPPCPFKFLTTYHCPGCGSLRSLHQLVNGNIVAAWSKNPMMITALGLLAARLCSGLLGWRRFLETWTKTTQATWTPKIVLAVIIGYGILRNIESYPWTLLGP